MYIIRYFIVASIFLFFPVITLANKKVALIIGNSDYWDPGFSKLSSSVNDARIMDRILKMLGYETVLLYDGTKQEMLDAIDEFEKKIKKSDVGIFYYSGHATNINYENYLLPCKKVFHSTILVEECIRVRTIQSIMKKNCKLSLLFLDACRSDYRELEEGSEFKGVKTPINIGKNENNTPMGLVTYYATENGKKAIPGETLSPFTKVLSSHLFDTIEFRSVWPLIQHEVQLYSDQNPTCEGSYSNDFYFNPNAIPQPIKEKNKKLITLNVTPSNARIELNGIAVETSTPLSFSVGDSYIYKIEAEGYQSLTGKIDVDVNTPMTMNFTLQKAMDAQLKIQCKNTVAGVYLDGIYKGKTPLVINTTTGRHDFTLTAHKYYSYESSIDIKSGINTLSLNMSKVISPYWDWDEKGFNMISYYFSPKYQLTVGYLYCPKDSRFSFGGMIGTSMGFYKGWGNQSLIVSSTSLNLNVDGVSTITTINGWQEEYSEIVDPYGDAKEYNANLLLLFDLGYSICNGIMLEAGIGAAYHQDRFYMPNTYVINKTESFNNSNELIDPPAYQYVKKNISHWYKQNTKWSPAARLGAKFLVPLNGFDKCSIVLGGGYTYLPMNKRFSSWDANIGFSWYL